MGNLKYSPRFLITEDKKLPHISKKHRRYPSQEANSLTTEITVNYNREIKKAFKYIRKNSGARKLTQAERMLESLHASPTKFFRPEEPEFIAFIQGMFSKEPSRYRKAKVTVQNGNVDYRKAEKLLQEAKKIIKHGVAHKKKSKEQGGEIEEFWYRNISKETTVRWDIFEEGLYAFLENNMVTDQGPLRKLNWKKFFARTYGHLGHEAEDYSLWPSFPTGKGSQVTQKVVQISQWVHFVMSGELLDIMCVSVQQDTFYLSYLVKNGSYEYACGAVYKGEWYRSRRYGNGVLGLKLGNNYEGTFDGGLRHEYGVMVGQGYHYKGDWKKDKMHGYGVLGFPDGSLYEGIWEKDFMKHGVYRSEHFTYEGYFENNTFEGEGKMTLNNGEVRKGNWEKGELKGVAEVTYPSGVKLKGQFVNDLLQGKGSMLCSEFNYVGQFKDSVSHGKGKKIWKNGNLYKGEFNMGEITGEGYLVTPDFTYEGTFEKGECVGKGKIEFKDYTYEGEVVKGVPEGEGKFWYKEGPIETYTGKVKNGLRHGYGHCSFRDEASYSGDWVEGELTGYGHYKKGEIEYKGTLEKGRFQGYGELKFPKGYYNGEWERSIPEGMGKVMDFNGLKWQGNFSKGQPTLRNKLQGEFLSYINSFFDLIKI